MSRLSRTTRVSAAVLLVAATPGMAFSAMAADVPEAVTDVRITETNAYTWSQLKVHVHWKVPDGTMAGDTFTLTLPKELRATDGTRFSLDDPAGQAVATAVVTGRTVTFTMTAYAETHVDVHGSAWFWVDLDRSVKPGDQLDLSFTVGSRVFPDDLSINEPGPGDPNYPYKWQTWMKATPDVGRQRILWAVMGPATPQNLVGSTYEITDLPGEGQEIDCEEVHVFSGKAVGTDMFTDAKYVSRDRWNLTCEPTKASVSITPRADEVGRAFRLLGQSVITDENRTEYRNGGSVRLWGSIERPVSSVIRAGGGGEGAGTTPSPTTTSPGTPTSPVPTETATNPASPAPTVTVTVTETPVPPPPATVTVTTTPLPTITVPGQPAPTFTVIVPGQPVATVTVTQTPVPLPTVTVTTTPLPTITVPGQPAPSPTVIVPGQPAPTPTATVPGTATPTSSPTVTVTTGTRPTPTVTVADGRPAQPVAPASQPHRIDTGVPQEGPDLRLAGAGGLLALGGGVGLIALSRRAPRPEES